MSEQLGAIVHKILFNDEKEKLPDPNKPENVPRIKAMEAAKTAKFKRFWEGEGQVLFERWQEKIRKNIFALLVQEQECSCKTCNKIREINVILKMLTEAQLIINKE